MRTVLGPAPMRIARPEGAMVGYVAGSTHLAYRYFCIRECRPRMFTVLISDARSVSDAR
jgi:hypothetical protein